MDKSSLMRMKGILSVPGLFFPVDSMDVTEAKPHELKYPLPRRGLIHQARPALIAVFDVRRQE